MKHRHLVVLVPLAAAAVLGVGLGAPAQAAGGYNLLTAAQLQTLVTANATAPTGFGRTQPGLYTLAYGFPEVCWNTRGNLQLLSGGAAGEKGFSASEPSVVGGYVVVTQYRTAAKAEAAGTRLDALSCPTRARMREDVGAPTWPVRQTTGTLPEVNGQGGRVISMTWTEDGYAITQSKAIRQIGNVVIEVAGSSKPSRSDAMLRWVRATMARTTAQYVDVAWGDSPNPPGS